MSGPGVSVVINNYNYGRYLRSCLESALRQTVPCEVVVVDDGSADESRQVLEEFQDRVVVVLQPNRGQAAAINAGIERASGDVVALLDADDVMHPRRAERVQDVFRQSPAQWLRHNLRLVDEAGRELSPTMYRSRATDDPAADLLGFGDTWGATSGLCFRRSFLATIGPIPEPGYRYYADAYLILAAGLLGQCHSLAESLCDRRQHAGQVSNRNRPTADHVRSLLRLRANLADTAERLSADGGREPVTGTWWQGKAFLQRARLDRLSRRQRSRLWREYVRAVWGGPLPLGDSLFFIARDTTLALVPNRLFETAWWYTHDGRPVLRRGTRSAIRAKGSPTDGIGAIPAKSGPSSRAV